MIAQAFRDLWCRLFGHDMTDPMRFGDVCLWRGCRRCGELEVDDR